MSGIMTAADEGMRIAEGIYGYEVEGQARASEVWRMTRLGDERVHVQALLRTEQRIIYGMDLTLDAQGQPETLTARMEQQGEVRASFSFVEGTVQGQIQRPQGGTPVHLNLPAGAVLFPASIAMRMLIGRALHLETDAEQPLTLCVIPVLDVAAQPLMPHLVGAQASVLGPETVDLLMAETPATRVLIEWPNHPPQHAWFDGHRFPVQWCWVSHEADGGSISHEFSLTRYAWHAT